MIRRIQWELKSLLRDRFAMLFLAAALGYMVLGLQYGGFFDYYGWAYFHQMLLWWFGLVGYRMGKESAAMAEWTDPIARKGRGVLAPKIGALLFCVVLIATAFAALLLTNGARILPDGIHTEAGRALLGEGALAVLLHYGLGGCVAGGIGLCMGRVVSRRWGYAVVLAVLFLMGPIGFAWVRTLAAGWPSEIQRFVLMPFELGVHNYRASINPFYGLETEGPLWFHRGFLLCLLGFAWTWIHRNGSGKNRRWRRGVFLGGSVLFLGLSLFSGEEHLENASFSPREENYESVLYYAEKEPARPVSPAFVWKEMDLRVRPAGTLKVTGKGILEMQEDSTRLSINLYHTLAFRSITYEGKELPFQADGDVVTVELPEKKKQGEALQLRFSYEGEIPSSFYAAKKAVLLPGFFNWTPQPAWGDAATRLGDLSVFRQADEPVTYRVSVDGKTKTVQSPGEAESFQSRIGPTLVDGLYTERTLDDVRVVTDPTRRPEHVFAYVKGFLAATEEFEDVFGWEPRVLRTVVAVRMPFGTLGNFATATRWSGSVLFTEYEAEPEEVADRPSLGERAFTEHESLHWMDALHASLADRYHFSNQDSEMQELFLHAFEYWIRREPPRRFAHEELLDFLQSETDPRPFFRAWSEGMDKPEMFTEEDLQRLLAKYR